MRVFNSSKLQLLPKFPTKPIKPNSYLFSSLTETPTKGPNTSIFNYLIETLNFSKTEAETISARVSHIKSPENPHSVVQYLRCMGFSEADIRSSVHVAPQILFSDVDKTLKPKMDCFQDVGLVGSDLGKFISKNSFLFGINLEKQLVPRLELLKKILVDDRNNKYLIGIISRCNWILTFRPESRMLSNIAVLERCGLSASQLSFLLRRQPRFFMLQESKVKKYVLWARNMGFSVDSNLFVHALHAVSGLSEETFESKVKSLVTFGFTKDEYMAIFLKQPLLLMVSEKKLKLGLEFFLNNIGLEKEALIGAPWCLMLSLDERVIPRYRVLQILRSKRLLKRDPILTSVLSISEKKFLERFVEKFGDGAEELRVAYKSHLLEPSSASSEEQS